MPRDEMASVQGCPYWIIDNVVNDMLWFRFRSLHHGSSYFFFCKRRQIHAVRWTNQHLEENEDSFH